MIRKVALWRVIVQVLGFVLAMLGLAIVLFPVIVPPLFARQGLPETDDVYARALGLRDLAVGL